MPLANVEKNYTQQNAQWKSLKLVLVLLQNRLHKKIRIGQRINSLLYFSIYNIYCGGNWGREIEVIYHYIAISPSFAIASEKNIV